MSAFAYCTVASVYYMIARAYYKKVLMPAPAAPAAPTWLVAVIRSFLLTLLNRVSVLKSPTDIINITNDRRRLLGQRQIVPVPDGIIAIGRVSR